MKGRVFIMHNIINILTEAGTEPCMVDVNSLHDALLQLPAEKYLSLYRLMKTQINDFGGGVKISASENIEPACSDRLRMALQQTRRKI